jgi:mono/diheme cytochrome c family protein
MHFKHKLFYIMSGGLGVLALQVFFLLFAGSATAEDIVKRGKYLVDITGCHDCHTPMKEGPEGAPVPDETLLLAGHPVGVPYPIWTPEDLKNRNTMAMFGPQLTVAAGPWGVSFATNLTPDKQTGMADTDHFKWTEEAFIQAIRTGKHHGQPNGRDILPPMPWPAYKHATDEDLKAIWAYLETLKPIKNKVPEPVPPAAPPAKKE